MSHEKNEKDGRPDAKMLEELLRIAPPEFLYQRIQESLSSCATHSWEFRECVQIIFGNKEGNLKTPEPAELDKAQLSGVAESVATMMGLIKDTRDNMTSAMMVASAYQHKVKEELKTR